MDIIEQYKCDLHVHSNNSDGSYTAKEIIQKAKEKNLIVALTDHNTTKGLKEFMSEAKRQEIEAVPGIEISTIYNNKELHLLGLFIDETYYDVIDEKLESFRIDKEKSNILLAENLKKAGYDISFEELRKKTKNGNVNRAHFAVALCEKGYFKESKEAFKTVLKDGYGLYFPPKRWTLFDAISFLTDIKAVPVLAHPLVDLTEQELRELLPMAKKEGLCGFEVMHSKYSKEDIDTALKIAEEFDMQKSGGSDFHGDAKPDVFLGVGKGNLDIPIDFYIGLKNVKKCKDNV